MKQEELTLIQLLVICVIEVIQPQIQELIDALPTEEELEKNKDQK
jgi:hypothetical protein